MIPAGVALDAIELEKHAAVFGASGDVAEPCELVDGEAARAEHGEESQAFEDADEAWKDFQRSHGIAETYQGKAKKEGDDGAKEAARIKKSLDRWIKDHRTTALSALAEHLDKYISRGGRFSYEPETELPWQT